MTSAPTPALAAHSRVRYDNPLHILFSCCLLPLLGVLKAVVFTPIPTLFLSAGCTVVAVLQTPQALWVTWSLIWVTERLGRNLRLLSFVLLPLFLCVWPLFVLLFTLLFGIFTIGFDLAQSVFDPHKHLLSGSVADVHHTSYEVVRDFHSWYVKHRQAEVHPIPDGWDGSVYEIPLWRVAVGFLLGLYGFVVVGVGAGLIVLPKLIFIWLQMVREYVSTITETRPHWFLFWLVGLALVIVCTPLLAVLGILGCFVFGPGACVAVWLANESVKHGTLEAIRVLRAVDVHTTNFCLNQWKRPPAVEYSCIPRVPDAARRPRHALSSSGRAADTSRERLDAAFDAYFVVCRAVGTEVVYEKSWVSPSMIEACDAGLLLGLPALAVFDILHASVEWNQGRGPRAKRPDRRAASPARAPQPTRVKPDDVTAAAATDSEQPAHIGRRAASPARPSRLTSAESQGTSAAAAVDKEQPAPGAPECGKEVSRDDPTALCLSKRLVCCETLRPRDAISNVFFPKLLKAKQLLSTLHPLTTDEHEYIRAKLVCGQLDTTTDSVQSIIDAAEKANPAPDGVGPREHELKQLRAQIVSLSISLSRLQHVKDRIPQLLDKLGKATM